MRLLFALSLSLLALACSKKEEEKKSYLFTLAKIDTTRLKISKLKEGVEIYNLKFNMYPNSMRDLLNPRGHRPIFKTTPQDDWGNSFIYKRNFKGKPFVFFSKGPDGIEGTDDDVY